MKNQKKSIAQKMYSKQLKITEEDMEIKNTTNEDKTSHKTTESEDPIFHEVLRQNLQMNN